MSIRLAPIPLGPIPIGHAYRNLMRANYSDTTADYHGVSECINPRFPIV